MMLCTTRLDLSNSQNSQQVVVRFLNLYFLLLAEHIDDTSADWTATQNTCLSCQHAQCLCMKYKQLFQNSGNEKLRKTMSRNIFGRNEQLPAVPQRPAHITFAVLGLLPLGKPGRQKTGVPRNPTVSKKGIIHAAHSDI